jgi:hypothetical protein
MYSYCYVCSVLYILVSANWHPSANLTEVFPCFSSLVRQIPGYNLQRRGTASTLPNYVVNCVVLLLVLLFCFIVLFYVLFVCKYVLYCCYRVTTQL